MARLTEVDADRCVIAISNVRPVPIQSLPKFLSSFTNVDGVATRTGNQVDEGTGLASEMAMGLVAIPTSAQSELD